MQHLLHSLLLSLFIFLACTLPSSEKFVLDITGLSGEDAKGISLFSGGLVQSLDFELQKLALWK
jgi:hypothetical protein